MVIFQRFRSSSKIEEKKAMKGHDKEKHNDDRIQLCGDDARTETSSLSSVVSEYQRCIGRRNRPPAKLVSSSSSLSESFSRKPSLEIITPYPLERNCSSGKKSVRFGDIHIREYTRIVGDNPSCSSGPPIGIGWDYLPASVERVDTYECSRGARKQQLEMVLTREDRERILLEEWGASWNDVLEAVRANHRAKYQRRRTVNNLGKAEKIEEVMESVARTLKRTLLLNKSTAAKARELEQQAKVACASKRRNSFPPSSMAHSSESKTPSKCDWEVSSDWASVMTDEDDDVIQIDDPSTSDDSLQDLLDGDDHYLVNFNGSISQPPPPSAVIPSPTRNEFAPLSSFAYVSRPTNFERNGSFYHVYEDRGDVVSVGNYMIMPPPYATSQTDDGPCINFQRNSFPIVITEDDGDDEQVSNYYNFSYHGRPHRESDFAVAPPPRSSSFVSSWT